MRRKWEMSDFLSLFTCSDVLQYVRMRSFTRDFKVMAAGNHFITDIQQEHTARWYVTANFSHNLVTLRQLYMNALNVYFIMSVLIG